MGDGVTGMRYFEEGEPDLEDEDQFSSSKKRPRFSAPPPTAAGHRPSQEEGVPERFEELSDVSGISLEARVEGRGLVVVVLHVTCGRAAGLAVLACLARY